MATPTHAHAEPVNNEAPSQGVFIGYLAMGLLILAIAVGALGVILGTING